MKKLICMVLCLCMVLSVLSGCRADVEEAYIPTGDALVMENEEIQNVVQSDETQQLSLVYHPGQSLNPIACTDYTNRAIFPLIYQGLFSVNQAYEIQYQLCKSYTVSDDRRVYEFTIDPRATFSDGSTVQAEDVSSSLHTAWKSAYYGGRFLHVNAIYPTEEGTLIIKLKQACDDLPLLLDIPIIKAEELEAETPLGTGPYILSGTETSRFLSRRSNWWCKSNDLLITAQRIPLLPATTVTEVRDYFEFDDAGIVCTDPGSDRYVDYRCDYELWDCETGLFVYLGFNLESSLFKNLGVRQAVLKGINRSLLADQYYRGFATAAELPASPNSPYYSKSLAQNYAYNDMEFQSLMAAQGVQGRQISLLVNSSDSLRTKVAQEIGRMLNTCGLIVTVSAVDSSTFKSRLKSGEFDLYVGQTKLSPNMDLSPFFSEGGSLSYGKIANIDQYNLCLQALENKGNYYTLHQSVMDQALICPLLFRSYAVYAARGLLTQLQPARDNLFCYTIE